MCGRIVIVFDALLGKWVTRQDAAWEGRPGAAKLQESHYNVAPRWPVAILLAAPEGPRLEVARWGFPFPGSRRDVINTRLERALESPLWRGLMRGHRAVVPVTGFYEWSHADGSGQPHFVRRADGDVMALAAVADVRAADGRERLCLSIVTCAANRAMAGIHDRMPAILEDAQVDEWLAPSGLDEQLVRSLAGARDGCALDIRPVSRRVNDPDADDERLIEEVAIARQTRLGV